MRHLSWPGTRMHGGLQPASVRERLMDGRVSPA